MNKVFLENYKTLVNFNLKNFDFSKIDLDILEEIKKYNKHLDTWEIYNWDTEIIKKSSKYIYPDFHPAIKKLVNICNTLNVKNILDVGSGNGKVTKYLYDLLINKEQKECKFSCLEGKKLHINEMIRNFKANNENITMPNINVKANFFNGNSQNMEFKDNNFDMVFTMTVMMHQPFIPALLTLCECARVTNKYVLHVENKNFDPNNKNYRHNCTCISSKLGLSELNRLPLDYKSIYEFLGFKTIQYYDFYDKNVPDALYTLYLGEKIN